MSPILVRPVREQLEHDRVIRQLQKDLSRRKFDVQINPGTEQNTAVGGGTRREFPDAVLFSTDKTHKLIGIIEVETGESVNHLEAMAQWAHYARLKAPFHLYVPMGSVDVARRLTVDHQIPVAEIHSYHQIGDLVRFASVYRSGTAPKLPDEPPPGEPPAKAKVVPAAPAPAPAAAAAKKAPPAKPVAAPKPQKAAKPAAKPVKKPAATAKKVAAVKAAPARKPAKAASRKAPPKRAAGKRK